MYVCMCASVHVLVCTTDLNGAEDLMQLFPYALTSPILLFTFNLHLKSITAYSLFCPHLPSLTLSNLLSFFILKKASTVAYENRFH